MFFVFNVIFLKYWRKKHNFKSGQGTNIFLKTCVNLIKKKTIRPWRYAICLEKTVTGWKVDKVVYDCSSLNNQLQLSSTGINNLTSMLGEDGLERKTWKNVLAKYFLSFLITFFSLIKQIIFLKKNFNDFTWLNAFFVSSISSWLVVLQFTFNSPSPPLPSLFLRNLENVLLAAKLERRVQIYF